MTRTATDAEMKPPHADEQTYETASAEMASLARCALDAAVERLLAKQHDEGYWCAELEGDSILQSEYILMKWILGEEHDPRLVKIANHLREQQRPDGAWAQYPDGKIGGGACDLSATVKGYFCLKLMGDDPNAPHMQRARDVILKHGGAERINTFSKYYLAALGQVSYNAVPIIPTQIVYLPKWFYFHLDKVSAWSRTMIIPLAIVTAIRPVRSLPADMGIDELFANPASRHRLFSTGFGKSKFWTQFFLKADAAMKLLHSAGVMKIAQRRAIARMERWMLEHCKNSDGPGAIFPPIVYLLIVLRACLGYKADDATVREQHQHLENYMIHGRNGLPRNKPEDAPADDETIHLQPCESPVWDTGIAAYALTDAGLDQSHPAMQRCAKWLLSKEVRTSGDWANNVAPGVKPAGWFFEFNNYLYPDVDDTAMVSMALKRIGGEANVAAGRRGVEWIFAMQNDDGGWAAFDKTEDRPIYDCVPFADHNAMQDPSCPDITGRTLECLSWYGYTADHSAVQRAIRYIQSHQTPEGCYFGRWGVNYIYGTWQSIGGLRGVGYDMTQPWVRRAGETNRD